jgi:hypothetical protein
MPLQNVVMPSLIQIDIRSLTTQREITMGKPTHEELEEALREAKRRREQGEDAHHLGKAVLDLHYQNGFLRGVLRAAENYLHSGMAETEHTQLVKAIEKARLADDVSAHREQSALGL